MITILHFNINFLSELLEKNETWNVVEISVQTENVHDSCFEQLGRALLSDKTPPTTHSQQKTR